MRERHRYPAVEVAQTPHITRSLEKEQLPTTAMCATATTFTPRLQVTRAHDIVRRRWAPSAQSEGEEVDAATIPLRCHYPPARSLARDGRVVAAHRGVGL